MKMRKFKIDTEPSTMNMTSLIDIVFLLISFFTLVINFSNAEQNERVLLPKSELAQPPDALPGEILTFQVTDNQEIVLGSITCHLDDTAGTGVSFSRQLMSELQVIRAITRTDPANVTAVIRADETVQTGFVQRLIAACQNQGMESFVLRARQARYE